MLLAPSRAVSPDPLFRHGFAEGAEIPLFFSDSFYKDHRATVEAEN